MRSAVLLLLCCCTAFSQSPVNPRTVESRSKQFVVRAGRAFDAFVPRVSNGRTLDLDPTLVAVTAERIKEIFLREMGLSDPRLGGGNSGAGKVYIVLQEARTPNVFAEAMRTPAGWTYRLEMPRQIEPPRLVEAIVTTLLLDMANRGNSGPGVELPRWLKNGMTEHLQALSMQGLVLQQNHKISKVELKIDPLASPRHIFSKRQPLTFEEISWPDRLEDEKADIFNPSAHLLVHYLFEQKEGSEGMARFIGLLKHRKNWQTAFLEGFGKWQSIVEIEKWWAVNMVQFTALDPANAWPRQVALQQMENALRVRVQVHSSAESLPENSTTDLTTVVLHWDNLRQEMGLQMALKQLRSIRPRLPADLVDLNDNYCATIESYLSQLASRNLGGRTLPQSAATQRKRTAKTFASLDSRFEEMKTMPIASAREDAIQRALQGAQPANR